MPYAVLTGASGIVGGAVAAALHRAGFTVIAPVRSAEARAKVLATAPGVTVISADFNTPDAAAALAAEVRKIAPGGINYVLAVGGGMAPFALATEVTPAKLEETVATKLGPQIWLAQALLPLVLPSGKYDIVTGALGEVPAWMPSAALTSVANGAVFAFAGALRAEVAVKAGDKPPAVDVRELRLAARVAPVASPAEGVLAASLFGDFVLKSLAAPAGKEGLVRISPAELTA